MGTNGFFLAWHHKGFNDGANAGWEAGYRRALQDQGLADIGPVPEPRVEYASPVKADLNETLEELRDSTELSIRGYNCLKREGVHTVGDLIAKTEVEVLDIRNMGQGTLDQVKLLLNTRGLELKSVAAEGPEVIG